MDRDDFCQLAGCSFAGIGCAVVAGLVIGIPALVVKLLWGLA